MWRTGLLAALATAVLLCGGGAEGRFVSRCELRKALGGMLMLPEEWQKFKNLILARVICDAEKRSNLSTNLVTLFAEPDLETTPAPTTTPIEPMPTQLPDVAMPTIVPSDADTTSIMDQTTESARVSAASNTSLSSRKRRAAEGDGEDRANATTETPMDDAMMGNQLDLAEMENPLDQYELRKDEGEAETVEDPDDEEEKKASDDDQGDGTSDDEDEQGESETSEEEEEEEGEEEEENEEENEEEENEEEEEAGESSDEEGGSRRKKRAPHWQPKPKRGLRFFGVLQLSDKLHCDSAVLRPSWNLCQTGCQTFIDGAIEDDLECFVNSQTWFRRLKRGRCADLVDYREFFKGCEDL